MMERRCRFCGKDFRKTEHLSRHERTHTRERPFHCTKCKKKYSRHDTLLRHSKLHDVDQLESPSREIDDMPAEEEEEDEATPNHSQDRHIDQPMDQHMEAASQLVGLQSSIRMHPVLDPYLQPSPAVEQPQLLQEVMRDPFAHTQVPNTYHGHQILNNYSLTGAQPISVDNQPSLGLWGDSYIHSGPSWLIGDDFDLEALNSSVAATVKPDMPLFRTQSRLQTPNNCAADMSVSPSLGDLDIREKLMNDVHNAWFTQVDKQLHDLGPSSVAFTGPATPETSPDRCGVDERYRAGLSEMLRPRLCEEPLPSTNYLNLCVQMYFLKFNPTFPIIHASTFRPAPENSLLLLSICSVGSLLIGSKAATAQGSKIFERLNKAILASWEGVVTCDSTEAVSMIQAALIGQTFGLLSGSSQHLATVESFVGTVIAWARRARIFKARRDIPQVDHLNGSELHEAWKRWVRSEEAIRIAIGLYVHDAELASMFHHEPLLCHDSIGLPHAASNELFDAPTATAWCQEIRRQAQNHLLIRDSLHCNQQQSHSCTQPLREELACRPSRMTAYVILHGISASVCAKRQLGFRNALDFDDFRDSLMCWYHTFEVDRCPSSTTSSSFQTDGFCLMVLWHSIFMTILVDFNRLERAIGRDGSTDLLSDSDTNYATQWATSVDAKRCILHAYFLQKALGSMRFDAEPAIHVPRCLFNAAIVWYCYTRFGRAGSTPSQASHDSTGGPISEQDLRFPEIQILDKQPPSHVFEQLFQSASPPDGTGSQAQGQYQNPRQRDQSAIALEVGTLCSLTDALQRIGHWNIARRFAVILGNLVHTETDEGILW